MAAELAEQSLSAVSTIGTVSAVALGILGLILAVLAVFGFGWIKGSAHEAATKVAADRIESYIKTQEFRDTMDAAVREAVRDRVKDKVILAHLSEERGGDEPDPFPSVEEAREP